MNSTTSMCVAFIAPMLTDMWSSYIVSDLYVQVCCLSTIVQQMSDLYGLSPL